MFSASSREGRSNQTGCCGGILTTTSHLIGQLPPAPAGPVGTSVYHVYRRLDLASTYTCLPSLALSDSFSFCQHNYHKYVFTSLISSIRSTYPCTSFSINFVLTSRYVWSRAPGKAVQFLFVGAPSLLNGVFIIRK